MSNSDVACGADQITHEHPDQRGLADAVGTDDTDTFAPLHIDGHASEEFHSVDAVAEAFA